MTGSYPWHKDVWRRWNELRSRLPHAILLKGQQGIGKFDLAMRIAQSMLCEQPGADGSACEACPSCHWFQQKSHPDFRLLQPEALSETEDAGEDAGNKKASRQISVSQVRTLSDFANLSSHRGGHRVVVIHPAETMNASAANALLKTLEEPPGAMLIILVSHKPQQLLPTIISRCLTLAVPMPAREASIAWLKQQGIDAPTTMLAQAGFAPLQVVRALEEGPSGPDEHQGFLREITQPADLDVYALAERLQRTEPPKVIHWLQQWCYDLGSVKLAGKVRYNTEQRELIEKLCARINVLDLMRYQKELLAAKREALHPLNPRLLFESLLLSYRQMMAAES